MDNPTYNVFIRGQSIKLKCDGKEKTCTALDFDSIKEP